MADLHRLVPVEAITGQVLHRAWLKSGRTDPLIDADAWDGFALTVQAVATMEGLVTNATADHCHCDEYVADSSGDAGCGNCGADLPPETDTRARSAEDAPDMDAEESEHTEDWLDGYEAGWKDSRAATPSPGPR